MVIHDDELNVNVRGANRKTRELGLVSEKTSEELQQYDIGQGEKIPTLEQTILLISELNKKHGKNLILNVELKGKNAAKPTYDIVKKYIDSRHINQKDVIYCSFNHEALKELKKIDPNNLVAPGIKTATLFGEENMEPGWIVRPGVSYQEGAMQKLDALAKELGVVALDAVLWDIDQEFIDVAKNNKVDVHASISDFRSFENKAFLEFLVKMQEQVRVYFKTDEPKVIREMLQERSRPIELDFGGAMLFADAQKVDQQVLARLAKPKNNESAAVRPPVGSMKFSSEGPASIVTEPNKNSVISGSASIVKTSINLKKKVDNMRRRLSSDQSDQQNIGSSTTYAINKQKIKDQSIFKK